MRSICVTERVLQHTYHSLLLGLIKLEPGTNNRTKGNCEAAIWTALRRFHSRLSSIPPSAVQLRKGRERESKTSGGNASFCLRLRFINAEGVSAQTERGDNGGTSTQCCKKIKNTGRDKRGLEWVKRRVSPSEGSLADKKHQITCEANYISLTFDVFLPRPTTNILTNFNLLPASFFFFPTMIFLMVIIPSSAFVKSLQSAVTAEPRAGGQRGQTETKWRRKEIQRDLKEREQQKNENKRRISPFIHPN